MIKTFERFVAILLVTCLIGAGIYWVVNEYPGAFGAGGVMGGMEGRGRPQGVPPAFEPGGDASENTSLQGDGARGGFARGPGDGRGHGAHEGGLGSGRWILGMVKNVAIIAVVTLLVGSLQKVISLFTRKRLERAA